MILFVLTGHALADPLSDATRVYNAGNYAKAAKLFMPLAEQGNAKAQFNLGLMYSKGQGVTKDYKEAAKWFQLAAEQGYAKAQYNLGTLYSKGRGVPRDNTQAASWHLKAALQDYARAQFAIAEMYRNGSGVPRNKKQAAAWYLKAANNRFPEAQYAVGLLYAGGILGFPRNYIQAHMWLSLAGDIAVNSKGWVEEKMTPEQIEKAKMLEQEWMNKAK